MPRAKEYESAAEKQRAYRARKNESVHFRSRSDMWTTPQDLFDTLNEEFHFDLDVAALPENAKCARFFTPKDDGLSQKWEGTCWMNPPYGRTVGKWIEKARHSAEENGATVVCLLPARNDTAWWHDHIASNIASGTVEARFLQGRLKFGSQENSAPFPSVIVVFHGNPLKARSGLLVRQVEAVTKTTLIKEDMADSSDPSDEQTNKLGDLTSNLNGIDTTRARNNSNALMPVTPVLPAPKVMMTLGDAGAGFALSPIVRAGGQSAARRYLEFFTVTIRNVHTRRAYYRAVSALLDFCEGRGVRELGQIQPMMIAAFIETRTMEKSAPTVKQELAAIRQLFDYLVTGHIVDVNPASAVRGPRYSIRTGKTPVLTREEARRLLESIPITHKVKSKSGGEEEQQHVVGLRDRALLALMVYSFARVGAVTKLKVGDYRGNGKRFSVRLHEKGGKFHELPVHHLAEEYLDAYLAAAGIGESKEHARTPLFRTSLGRTRALTDRGMTPSDVLYMVKRRAATAGLPAAVCCHTFRATGITAYLENGGTVENAQAIASHADPRTTRLYDRRSDKVTLTEIERIQL